MIQPWGIFSIYGRLQRAARAGWLEILRSRWRRLQRSHLGTFSVLRVANNFLISFSGILSLVTSVSLAVHSQPP